MRTRCNLTALVLLTALLLLAQNLHGDERGEHLFDWQQLPPLPMAVEGAFVGVSDDVLIVAGGCSGVSDDSPEVTKYSDAVFVLKEGAEQWQMAGKLDEPLAFGGTVETDLGLLCIGGRGGKGLSDRVVLLRWDAKAEAITIVETRALPRPVAMLTAAKLGDTVYVAGGRTDGSSSSKPEKVFWSLDVSKLDEPEQPGWQSLPPCPGAARFAPVFVAQSKALYVIGGSASCPLQEPRRPLELLSDAYCYDPISEDGIQWQRIADPPIGIAAAPALAYGSTSIVVFGGLINPADAATTSAGETAVAGSDIYVYETITDTWTARGTLPQPIALTAAVERQGHIEIPGGRADNAHPSSDTLQATPKPWQGSFHAIDYAVLGGYLLLLVWVGWHFSGREKNTDDYLLGGHRIPWWAAGLSILATQVSSIGFMAIPAKSFATNWVYFAGVSTWFVAVPIVIRYYIPFFRALNVTTAYEYLEYRFNVIVRLYGSCAFIMLQLGRMAIVLYLPAIALSVVTGMDVYLSILVMGVLSTAYTVMGGIEAVIWTDVLQAGVLMGGAMLGVIVAISGIDGGVGEFFTIANANAKFHIVNWDMDFTTTAIWVVLLGNAFQRTADLTADQTVVQRYLSTRDERQSARAVWASVAASVPWAMTVFLLGTALFAFFKSHPEQMNPALQTDAIVPWFVVEQMPAGISGLVIAALFAAAMSSLDSSIHSVATTLTIDFYKRFRPHASDRSQLVLARWLTAILGAVGTATALLAATYQIESLWDLFIKFAGLAVGGLAGLFMLGIFTRRANGIGAVAGAVAGAGIMFAVQSYTHVHFFLYPVIGIGSCFIIGYVVSVLVPIQRKSLAGLTVHTPVEKTD